MKLYAFSDFHLSGDPPTKPMDIFGQNWHNHREKIVKAWLDTITPEDTVIMAVLHYPPFDENRNPSHMVEIMKKYHVTDCIYGHIHGAPNFVNLPDELEGIKLHLTSADYLDFKPYYICDLEAPHA